MKIGFHGRSGGCQDDEGFRLLEVLGELERARVDIPAEGRVAAEPAAAPELVDIWVILEVTPTIFLDFLI